MDPIEQAFQTMTENLKKNTGKSLAEWVILVNAQHLEKHGQIVNFLKKEHNFTHGFANFVAHKSKGSDANSQEDKAVLIDAQYKGKEHFKSLYESLLETISSFGEDVEISPKKTYVSLRRKKQFAMLQPATKTRFEIGLNLKGVEPQGKLVAITADNAMCSHKINLTSEGELDQEVLDWIKKSYDNAG